MTDVKLRSLTEKDWELLRAMRIRAAKLHPNLFYDTEKTATERPVAHWQSLLAGKNNRFWGLFDGNKCVGTTGTTAVTSDPTGQTGMIGYNFIEAEYRGHKYSDLFFEVGLTHALECKEWKMYITDHRDGNAVKS